MRHAFNVREGLKPSDFKLTRRAVGKPPLTAGPLQGVTVDEELLGKNFFESAGIDFETGKPSLELLQKLGGLDEVIADMYVKAGETV